MKRKWRSLACRDHNSSSLLRHPWLWGRISINSGPHHHIHLAYLIATRFVQSQIKFVFCHPLWLHYLSGYVANNVCIMINCIAEIIIYEVIGLEKCVGFVVGSAGVVCLPSPFPQEARNHLLRLWLENRRKIALILFFHATNNNPHQLSLCSQFIIYQSPCLFLVRLLLLLTSCVLTFCLHVCIFC